MSSNLPVAVDLSKSAIQKAVASRVAQNPALLYSAVIGALGLTAGMLFSIPIVAIVGGVGVVGGVGWGIVDYYFRYDANADGYVEAMRSLQRKFVAEMPDRLRTQLTKAGAERGLQQLDELESSFTDFQELLGRKFSQNGMALNRLLGTAEQVRAGALYKLQMVLDQLKAIESIPKDLDRRLKSRETNGDQARLIQERSHHRQEALDTIDHLYTDVEESLTRLTEISVRIANVGIGEDEGASFESYLDELKTLAAQASTFHKET